VVYKKKTHKHINTVQRWYQILYVRTYINMKYCLMIV